MANNCSSRASSWRRVGKRMKKRKAAQLHDLPDDILVDVLSHLGFADAARTSVLLSRWRRLWRACDGRALVFTRETMFRPRCPAQGEEDFVRNVDRVLRQLSPTDPREKFRLEFRFIQSNVECHVNQWVAFCAASRAKDIVFDFNPGSWGSYSRDFPLNHFRNGSPAVRSLHLMSVDLYPPVVPPDFCGFTNLRELKLDSVVGDIHCLLLPAFSVLEWLSITCCPLHSFSTSQPLGRLRYMCVQYCQMHELEVQAPNLAKFQFASFEVHPVFVLDECVDIQEVTVTVLTEKNVSNYAFAKLPAGGMSYARKLSIQIAIDTQVLSHSRTEKAGTVKQNTEVLCLCFTGHRASNWSTMPTATGAADATGSWRQGRCEVQVRELHEMDKFSLCVDSLRGVD